MVTIWALVKAYNFKIRCVVVMTALVQLILATAFFATRNLRVICAIPIISHNLSFVLLFLNALSINRGKSKKARDLRLVYWVAFSFVILACSITFFVWGMCGRVDALFPGQYFCVIGWTMAGIYQHIRMQKQNATGLGVILEQAQPLGHDSCDNDKHSTDTPLVSLPRD
jgi:hypothetical protein